MARYDQTDPRPSMPGGGPWSSCHASTASPGCNMALTPLCDVQKVAKCERGVTGANGTATLTLAPIRSNYFQALAVRMAAIDATSPDVNRRLEIHTLEINSFPQEAFSNASILAANTSVVLVDDYVAPEGYGVPVGWGIFAQANMIQVLQIGVLNIEQAGVDIDFYVSAYGNALEAVPPGFTLGQPLTPVG